jgi:hypothetical protein
MVLFTKPGRDVHIVHEREEKGELRSYRRKNSGKRFEVHVVKIKMKKGEKKIG